MIDRGHIQRMVGYVPGTGFGVWAINLLVQRIFRVDAACRYNKHFTSRVTHSHRLEVEDDCPMVCRSLAVSGGCYINAADGLWIGKGTIWAPNVAIVSQDHGRDDLGQAPPTPGIRVGRDCWLGFGCVILPGVVLGDRTIVGANAVVTHSFPKGSQVIGGVPARVINHESPCA
jgi:acetyltransferase-like isoleucine patch superfamily enzyme